jgi:hypothetical protein
VFTLSPGARYEAQTNISDHNNLDRGWAWLPASKTMALRGRVCSISASTATRQRIYCGFDGDRSRSSFEIKLDRRISASANASPSTTPSIRVRAADLATPYTINSSIFLRKRYLQESVDLLVGFDPRRASLSKPQPERDAAGRLAESATSWDADSAGSYGREHQSAGIDGIVAIQQFHDRLQTDTAEQMNPNWFGNYTLGHAYSDTDGAFSLPANNYDLRSEWGRGK